MGPRRGPCEEGLACGNVSIVRTLSALLLVPAVLLSIVPFVACDDGGATSSGSLPDGATGFDAAAPDGATAPLPDGAAPDATPGPSDAVTVVLTKSGAPVAGVLASLHDDTGAVTASAKSGADGKVSLKTTTSGQLTIALGAAGNAQLLTYVGVKPGDAIEVAVPDTRNVRFTVPTLPAGNSGLHVVVGNEACSTNSAGGNPLVLVTNDCITGPTFAAMGSTFANGTPWFAFEKDVTPAATGETPVSLGAWVMGGTFTFSVTNVPNGSFQGFLGQVADNQAYTSPPNNGFVVTAGAGSAVFGIANGYGDGLQPEAQITTANGVYASRRVVAQRIAGTATSATLDLGGNALLPEITSITADSITTARPKVTWTAAAALGGTDSGVIEITWPSGKWTFLVPPGTTTVTAPALPTEVATWAPDAPVDPTAAFFESDLVPGYDVVRQKAASFGFTRVPDIGYAGATPGLPANGTVKATMITQNPG